MKNKDRKTGKFVKTLQEKKCLACNLSFKPRTAIRKVCSFKCRNILLSSMFSKKIDKVCKGCNSLFSVSPSQGNAKHCSPQCYGLTMKGKFGELSNGWMGGKTSLNQLIRSLQIYHFWRQEIFKRDNFKCILCNKDGELNADHIVPFAIIIRENEIRTLEQAINYKALWDIKNGRTLCIECHKKTPTYLKRLCHTR